MLEEDKARLGLLGQRLAFIACIVGERIGRSNWGMGVWRGGEETNLKGRKHPGHGHYLVWT